MKGMAIASMVLGIISLALFWVLPLPVDFIIPIVGLILGIIGKRRLADFGEPTGLATAGIVLCIIALAYATLFWIACVACVGGLALL